MFWQEIATSTNAQVHRRGLYLSSPQVASSIYFWLSRLV